MKYFICIRSQKPQRGPETWQQPLGNLQRVIAGDSETWKKWAAKCTACCCAMVACTAKTHKGPQIEPWGTPEPKSDKAEVKKKWSAIKKKNLCGLKHVSTVTSIKTSRTLIRIYVLVVCWYWYQKKWLILHLWNLHWVWIYLFIPIMVFCSDTFWYDNDI